MIDDQDRCEWVDVSRGTGSPGLTWTKGRKTAVVVASCHFADCRVSSGSREGPDLQ